MSMLVVVASVKAKPGKGDALRPILKSLLAPTLAEAGCMRYEMNEAEDGQSWMFVEQWESKALWDRHMETPHLARFKAVADELVGHFELFTGAEVRA
jgi:quinol monooxygenase YgiN